MAESSTEAHEGLSATDETRPVPGTASPSRGPWPRAVFRVLLALWIAGTALMYFIRWTADFYRANRESLERIMDWFSS